MTADFTSAIKAYNQSINQLKAPATEARDQAPAGPGFADVLKNASDSVQESLNNAEKLSVQAVAGKADMQEVAMAIANAEMSLQMAVSVRDKVIQAYQEILRMPV